MVNGHALTLHETNSGTVVPLCECGWVGVVHWAHYGATFDHEAHVAQELLATAPRREYDPALVERVAKIVRRPGRFSSGT